MFSSDPPKTDILGKVVCLYASNRGSLGVCVWICVSKRKRSECVCVFVCMVYKKTQSCMRKNIAEANVTLS